MTLLLAISESEAEAELKKQITTLDLGPSDLVLPTESQEMENVWFFRLRFRRAYDFACDRFSIFTWS